MDYKRQNCENKGEILQDKPTHQEEIKPYMPHIPFLQWLKAHTQTKKFIKFLDMFKNLELNLPFLKVISQMPNCANFLKEIVGNKKRLEKYAMVALTEVLV